MTFSQLPLATLSPILLALTLSQVAGQSASDLYRITDGVTQSRTEFHQVSVPMGHEHILADLRGPGKGTYLYFADDTVGKWDSEVLSGLTLDGVGARAMCVARAASRGTAADR